jgi:hypothetical protein
MIIRHTLIGSVLLLAASLVSRAAEALPLDDHLEPLRPFLGRTWRGEFKESTPAKPVVDVARWERVLNGKAIRILHSINDGAYGGESIVRWDSETKQLVYYYFTTAGFMTKGSLTVEGAKVVAMEKVTGEGTNVTDVRSTSELRADGTLLVKADYLKNGERTGGREVVYREAPQGEVKFK